MKATVGEVCSRDVVACSRATSIESAAELMRRHHVGALVVTDDQRDGRRVPVGMITDRDIAVGVVAKGLGPDGIHVAEVMVPELVDCRASESIFDILQRMRAHGVRRMPVVDGSGALMGLVSASDVLAHLADELTALTRLVAREREQEVETRI